MKKISLLTLIVLTLNGCATTVHVAVDPSSIKDKTKFDEDYRLCQDVARTYDLSQDTANNAILGAATGGVVVAGIATAIAGAVFAPAIPFIIAGGAAGGGLAGGITKTKETEARENILSSCLSEKGYKAFGAARVR